MKTESSVIIDAVKRCSGHYIDLKKSTKDCNTHVDAELDLLEAECQRMITKAEKANIKKLAKAIASESTDSIKDEADSLAQIVSDFRREPFKTKDPDERIIFPRE